MRLIPSSRSRSQQQQEAANSLCCWQHPADASDRQSNDQQDGLHCLFMQPACQAESFELLTSEVSDGKRAVQAGSTAWHLMRNGEAVLPSRSALHCRVGLPCTGMVNILCTLVHSMCGSWPVENPGGQKHRRTGKAMRLQLCSSQQCVNIQPNLA